MHVASIGIDLGETTFHLVALDEHGKIVRKKKFSRKQLLAYTPLQSALIGIQACSGARFIGAALRYKRHDVRLITAQFVKPFVRSKAKGVEMVGNTEQANTESFLLYSTSGCILMAS